MKIRYEKKALKFLSKKNKAIVDKIREKINGLTLSPPEGDIKTLEGYKDGRKRLRYGKYRIIFRYDNEVDENKTKITILLIMNIGSRGDIYKED